MTRQYAQFCALATALEAVGDRWTLLIVRELLPGPKRYRELLVGLPGVPTNLLADRLRKLEAEGLVARVDGDPDRRARCYELTVAGAGLGDVLVALTRFGLQRLPPDADDLAFRLEWLELAVHALLRPDALRADLVVRFEHEDQAVQLRLSPHGVARDHHGEADVVITGGPGALMAAVRAPDAVPALVRAGSLTISGDRSAVGQLSLALGSLAGSSGAAGPSASATAPGHLM